MSNFDLFCVSALAKYEGEPFRSASGEYIRVLVSNAFWRQCRGVMIRIFYQNAHLDLSIGQLQYEMIF